MVIQLMCFLSLVYKAEKSVRDRIGVEKYLRFLESARRYVDYLS